MEKNLNDLQRLMVATFDRMPTDRRWASVDLCRQIGKGVGQRLDKAVRAAARPPVTLPDL